MSMLSIIFYTSMIGVFFVPKSTTADVADSITIDGITNTTGNTYKVWGSWAPQGNQCFVPGSGFHYRVRVTDNGTPISLDPAVNPAACNSDYTDPVVSGDRGTGGPWPASGQTEVTFNLTPGSHTICALLVHVNNAGQDELATSVCWPENIIVPPVCGDGIQQTSEQCDDGNLTNFDGCSSTCTQEGRVQLVKLVDPATETTQFTFHGIIAGNISPRSTVSRYVTPGTHTTWEDALAGWELTDITCDDSDSTGDISSRTVTYRVAAGETVKCTFTNTLLPVCGNNVSETGEQCDDGNLDNNDGCSATCLIESCGDGIKQTSEACDDGNIADNDGCSATCLIESCGDGIQQTSEACDDANSSNNDSCLNSCQLAQCGDGYIEVGVEECDDNNNLDNDGCSVTCLIESCGDGIKQTSEACDDGNTANNDSCSASCLVESCGDGIKQTSEACDDNNNIDNDGCSARCLVESCGDGIKQTSEACDDGNTVDNDGCSATCLVEYCGDGIKQTSEQCEVGDTQACIINNYAGIQSCNMPVRQFANFNLAVLPIQSCTWNPCEPTDWCGDNEVNGLEVCDDGNTNNDDTCKNDCTVNTHTCGNEILQTNLGEVCDEGANNGVACVADYNDTCQYCTTACDYAEVTGPSCGDNIKNGAEECDNTDGVGEHQTCTDQCLLETVPYCGDNIKNGAEECDNTDGATGDQTCSATCTIVEPEPEPLPPPVTPEITSPKLTIEKSVEAGTYYPGSKINYIVTIENTGTATAYNVRLADNMPAGFTYDDGSDGSWFFNDLKVGEEMNFIYTVTAGTTVTPGTYTNTAQVSADDLKPVKDTADVAITKKGAVLGAEDEGEVAGDETLPQAGSNVTDYLMYVLVITVAAFGAYGFRKVAVAKKYNSVKIE
ncbi:MAG: DUF4215 domain-containing protein [Patescibacteria group bacterium]